MMQVMVCYCLLSYLCEALLNNQTFSVTLRCHEEVKI